MSILHDTLRDVQTILVKVPALVAELERRARSGERDGYPAGGDGSRGSSTATPTEGAALANLQHPADALAESIIDDIAFIARILTEAEDDAARRGVLVDVVEGVPKVRRLPRPAVTAPDNEMWCRHHVTFSMFEPTHRRGLCRWCDEWDRNAEDPEVQVIKALAGALPPRRVLEVRAQGRLTGPRLAEIRAGLQREAAARTRRRKRTRKR